jgi:MFS family permease
VEDDSRRAWTVAVALFVSLFFLWGGGYNTAPIFLAALLRAFHWSHARVALISGGLSLAIGLTGPVAGYLLDRVQARMVMGVGGVLAIIGLIAASRSHTFAELFAAIILLGIGLGASTWLAASVVIANWFGEKRGTALGVVTAGMESGGMVMTFVVGSAIAVSSWRTGYLLIAIPSALVALPLILIFAQTHPPDSRRSTQALVVPPLAGYEVAAAVRTRAFWMLVIAQLAYGLAMGGIFHHLVAFLEGIGYGPRAATLAVSSVLGLAAAGKALMGALGDRIGGKNALALGLTIIAASVTALLAARSARMLALWLLMAGIAGASPVALVPMVLAETLGLKRFGSLFGWLGLAVTAGLFVGPLMVGWVTDLTASYNAAFQICALIAMGGAVASFACTAPYRDAAPNAMAAALPGSE